ncbi:hypothetical protein [Flavobacterium sp. I3-2]|uniref:hypothetical protein n=1 Tax=Flavobacterium sp. I3-2 TaxID=2748319 RepID=UPI0015AFF686|nr:hypothetical protein [Flavobacterium sp. I3-2]
MSLHFQIDIAFDLKDNISNEITSNLEKIFNEQILDDSEFKDIPKIIKNEIARKKDNLSFLGRDIFYFKRHYRYTENKMDIYRWTIHFRTMLSDDIFYEEGYPLIAWFAILSETKGFVGYIKEELELEPRLIYFENNEVVIKENSQKKIKFMYTDFS